LPSSDLATARGVFLRLLIDGLPVEGAIEAELTASDHQAADHFRITLALGVDPIFTAATFASLTQANAEILVGLAPPGAPAAAALWQSLILGPVDDIAIDVPQRSVALSGRDLSALFIDTLTAETFSNNTASEIAQTLAVRHGMIPAITPTTTPIGRYYQAGQDLSSLYQSSRTVTEWDLLVTLAAREGFDLYVQNETLFFAPPLAATLPDIWQWGGSALIDLRLNRTLAFARDISVTVQSWNSKQATMITQTVRASHEVVKASSTATSSAPTTTYVLVRPNLTAAQALTLATQTLSDLSRHERVATATMVGDLTLAPRSAILLAGTDTAFDQLYIVDEITRHISTRDGFTQTVRAVNRPSM
jgi:phage protein D